MTDQPDGPEGAGRANSVGTGANSTPWRAIVAIAGVVLIVGVVAIALLLRDNTDPIGGGSGAPSPTAAPSPSTAASPTTTSEPSSEAPSPSPTVDATTIPSHWTAVATFSEPGKRYLLGDLTEWSGGLIAVGSRWEVEFRTVFGPPPPRAGVVWRSTDVTEWAETTPAGTFDGVQLDHVFQTDDGALIVTGTTWEELDPVGVVFESSDGESWHPAALEGIGGGWSFMQVTSGGQGWLATVWTGTAVQVMSSSDGRSWTPVAGLTIQGASIAAGDEGFVVTGIDEINGSQVVAIAASGDGVTWFDAATPEGDWFLIAPQGGDWVAVGSTYGDSFSARAWASSNGLDWSELGAVPTPAHDVGGGVECQEAPGSLLTVGHFLSLGTTLLGPCSEGGVISAGRSYASLDGGTWLELPFGEQATAIGAAAIGDRFVIGTDARTNSAPMVGVTFWINEP